MAVETRIACNCSLKTALVPTRKHAHWRTIMAEIPFGADAVVNTWPYLGAAATSSVDDSQTSISLAGDRTTNTKTNDARDPGPHTEESARNTLVSIGAVIILQAHSPNTQHDTATQDDTRNRAT